jgi:DNA polymerase-1
VKVPNLRKVLIPDPGYLICESDLAQADAQVVAWEADDQALMDFFIAARTDLSLDLHTTNAEALGLTGPAGRQLAKAGVHATNYGASVPRLAKVLGITKTMAQLFVNKWFAAHPAIPRWHERTQDSLNASRSVTNKFGYTRRYFERPDSLLPEALAWVPQSTVALVIDKGWANIDRELYSHVEVLLQVHDSLVYQIKKRNYTQSLLEHLHQCLHIEIPYDNLLTIPVGISISEKSWGHCEETTWKIAA